MQGKQREDQYDMHQNKSLFCFLKIIKELFNLQVMLVVVDP